MTKNAKNNAENERGFNPETDLKKYGIEASNKNRFLQIVKVLVKNNVLKGFTPEKLRKILEELGPTYVKLGQIMSMRPDILPTEYCKELENLRANVTPMPTDLVIELIEDELKSSMKKVFKNFDPTALGSASIAQVHYAELKTGEKAVIKIQRPGIFETMKKDITLLKKASRFLKIAMQTGDTLDFDMLLDEMWSTTMQELNFLTEAENLREMAANNADVEYVRFPKVYPYTTTKLLVMEYIDGIAINDTQALTAAEYDISEICSKLCENYVKQIIDDAFFHADPHPGNIRIKDGKIVWLDLGMTGRLSARDKQLFRQGVRAVAEKDVNALKDIILTIGVYSGTIDHPRLYADIDNFLNKYASLEMGQMDVGDIMNEILAIAKTHDISIPKGVSMFGRGLVTIQGVIAELCPDMSVLDIMANHVSANFLQDLDLKKETSMLARNIIGSLKKSTEIPSQLSEFLKLGIRGQALVNIKDSDTNKKLKNKSMLLNRWILALLMTTLLISSALLAAFLPAHNTVMGIPVIAFVGFCFSFLTGIWLVLLIIRYNKKNP